MSFDTLIPVLGVNLIWQTLLLAIVVGAALKALPKHAVKARYRIALIALFGSGLLCAAPFLPDFTPQISVGLSPQMVAQESAPAFVATHIPLAEKITAEETVAGATIPMGKVLFLIWLTGSCLALLR